MPVNQLYNTCLERIKQLRPKERITRLRNFAWMAAGIMMSRSVHLSYIARKMAGLATTPSKVRRLSRFLDNGAIRVREWYEPLARKLLQSVVDHGLEVRLLVDGTKVSFGHQLLMVAVAYRRRAIPLAWTWVPSPKGHSSAYKQRALLAYVRGLMPNGARVLVVGDSEFGAIEVLKQLDRWKWHYVMRQKSNTWVKLQEELTWLRFGRLLKEGDRSRWSTRAWLTWEHAYSTNLLVYWKAGEEKPWLLATNLPTARETLRAYKRRMWIEEMFGDFKKHGFDLESSHLRHFLRLSRLTLIVAFLYFWLVAFGSQVIKRGQRRLVDRPDRKDLSIFRIGLDMAERCLANAKPLVIRFVPYFS
jgi:hypothetical protein